MSRPRPNAALVHHMDKLSKSMARKKKSEPPTKEEELLTFTNLLRVCQTGGQFAKRKRKS